MQKSRLTLGETLQAPDPSPFEKSLAGERKRILALAQDRLTGRQAMLLILRYEQDYTFLQIAKEFQVSEVAVFQMHARILRVLMVELAGRRIYALRQIL